MAKRIKNVILLTVDSLRYDRLGSSGYSINQTPSIDFLARNGIVCSNAFTPACGTQFSFPSLFTSTLPLDRGGYDHGIRDREISFVEILRDNGLNTVGFPTCHWLSRFFYYNRGFNEFHQVFGIAVFWRNMRSIFMEHYINLKDKGIINSEECLARIRALLEEALQYAVKYHEESENHFAALGLRKDRYSYSHNHRAIIDLLEEELELLNKKDYSFHEINNFYKKLIPLGCGYKGWFNLEQEPDLKRNTIWDFIIERLKANNILKTDIYRSLDAEHLKNIIVDWADKNRKVPFFLWAHFMDIHCKNYTTGPFKGSPKASNYFGRLIAGRRYYGDVTYDASCKYVDKQIGCIIKYLKCSGLFDSTLIIITSDHGMDAGMPYRNSHGIAYFYEEFVKIPLIFYNPALGKKTVSELCGTMDIAPTILEILGIKSPISFKGASVLSPELAKRRYLRLEHSFKGACDIKNKPIYLALRTKKYKYIWREYIESKDMSAKNITELYDLERDRFETNNLSHKDDFRSAEKEICEIAMERFKEISIARKGEN